MEDRDSSSGLWILMLVVVFILLFFWMGNNNKQDALITSNYNGYNGQSNLAQTNQLIAKMDGYYQEAVLFRNGQLASQLEDCKTENANLKLMAFVNSKFDTLQDEIECLNRTVIKKPDITMPLADFVQGTGMAC